MGYSTDFEGCIYFDKPLTSEQGEYLRRFNETRHMMRSGACKDILDPLREKVNLPIGTDGEFFVGQTYTFGDPNILDHNRPPCTQPGLWCQWVPTDDNSGLVWDQNDKFYKYVEWMKYIIDNFLKPWGITANGIIRWRGEDFNDIGTLEVEDNEVTVTNTWV